jgi:hypothetical protein
MSLLDPIDDVLNCGDNFIYRQIALENNPYREGLEVETYIKYSEVYAKVMTFYVKFFHDYWYKDNVEKTNEKMIAEMNRVGLNGWSGLTEAENNPLGEYVLSLDCPAKTSDIEEFFKRVMTGDLEFLCRYPIDETNALNLIGSVYSIR